MTEFDPYRELGVGPTAGDKEIKAAYKRRAKETHPDTGGSAEEFEKVGKAYRLLTDETARERYDKTGSTEHQADNTLANAINTLGFRFAAALGHPNAERVDIVRLVRDSVVNDIKKQKGEINTHKTNIDKIEKVMKRIVKKGGDLHDFVKATYEDMIRDARKKILHAEDEIMALEKALDLVKVYSCKPPESDLDEALARVGYREFKLSP